MTLNTATCEVCAVPLPLLAGAWVSPSADRPLCRTCWREEQINDGRNVAALSVGLGQRLVAEDVHEARSALKRIGKLGETGDDRTFVDQVLARIPAELDARARRSQARDGKCRTCGGLGYVPGRGVDEYLPCGTCDGLIEAT